MLKGIRPFDIFLDMFMKNMYELTLTDRRKHANTPPAGHIV